MYKCSAIFIGLIPIFFISCVPIATYENSISEKEYLIELYKIEQRLPQLITSKYTTSNIYGKYYFTYVPLLFSETEEIRKSRHKFLENNFALIFPDYGLTPTEYGDSTYEINYHYNTFPQHDGTFEHTFDLNIYEKGGLGSQRQQVWHGALSIGKTTSPDISLYFNTFLAKILTDFPNPQNTRRDFDKKIKKLPAGSGNGFPRSDLSPPASPIPSQSNSDIRTVPPPSLDEK